MFLVLIQFTSIYRTRTFYMQVNLVALISIWTKIITCVYIDNATRLSIKYQFLTGVANQCLSCKSLYNYWFRINTINPIGILHMLRYYDVNGHT